MGAILRPRRGTKAVADSKNFVLAKGEIFFEVPSGGVGKGLGRIKMGDGSTAYTSLPYFQELDLIAATGLDSTSKSTIRTNIGAGTSNLSLGTSSSTAYRGDYGNTAYTHSQSTHARTDATAVAASSTNGKITINGTETTVYTHPGSGTNPHGTTKSDVGLGNVGNFKAVSTVASQGLTDTEKSNARANIGAGTSSLALGTTSSTAYRGDYGNTAYTHSQSTHARTDATAVAASTTNGKIKINGTETTVYTHPGSGTNPHGTTKSDVGLGNVGNFKAVSTVASQGLSDTEKSNARTNIAAASAADVTQLNNDCQYITADSTTQTTTINSNLTINKTTKFKQTLEMTTAGDYFIKIIDSDDEKVKGIRIRNSTDTEDYYLLKFVNDKLTFSSLLYNESNVLFREMFKTYIHSSVSIPANTKNGTLFIPFSSVSGSASIVYPLVAGYTDSKQYNIIINCIIKASDQWILCYSNTASAAVSATFAILYLDAL